MMAEGDVIGLNTVVGDALTIKVGNVPKFTAQPGRVNRKLAVQVLDYMKGGEEDDK
jgi:flagellar motor switch protein FliM